MKKQHFLIIVLIAHFFATTAMAETTVTFPSLDGLTITADVYATNDTLPYMILCHQAGFSRGEYKETALKFAKLGYNCIAIDARSGNAVNEVKNQTAALAKELKKSTTYLDAEQDIIATINYISTKSKKKVVLVGSSYSASLVLKIATTNERVKAVLAFSPGEYFGELLNLKETIKTLNKPVFTTSSKEEAADLTVLMNDIISKQKQQFIPSEGGKHGSKALWKANENNQQYWMAVMLFLKSVN
jgi:dienelactone hydrolase